MKFETIIKAANNMKLDFVQIYNYFYYHKDCSLFIPYLCYQLMSECRVVISVIYEL